MKHPMNNFPDIQRIRHHFTLFHMLAACAIITALAGCAKNITPPHPGDFGRQEFPPPRSSVANVAINIPLKAINELMESRVPKNFRESGEISKKLTLPPAGGNGDRAPWPLAGLLKDGIDVATVTARWKADITREGLSVSVGENLISIGTRLKGSITAEKAGIRETAQVEGLLSAESLIHVTPDWRLCTNTTGSFNAQKAEIRLFNMIPVSCQGLLEEKLESELNRALARFDLELPEKLNIRPQAEKIWEMCRKPVRLSANPETWLVIKPLHFKYSGFGLSGNKARILVGLNASVETVIGPRPADSETGPLPALENNMTGTGFVVTAPVRLHYSQAREIVGKVLLGRKYRVKNNVTVSLKGIDIYGNGPMIVVRADFTAHVPGRVLDADGRVFLTGRLRHNPESCRMWVEELEYDLDSYNLLLKTADYLRHEGFVKSIQNELDWNLSAEVEKQLAALNSRLEKVRVKDGIEISAHVDKGEITAVATTPEGILAQVAFSGDSSVTISSL